MPDRSESFLPKGGNYRELLSYRKAEVVYDFTFRFCERFFTKGDRTIDQMVQAARSGKQNIAEASRASVTSTETELKLTNVARASLEELLSARSRQSGLEKGFERSPLCSSPRPLGRRVFRNLPRLLR